MSILRARFNNAWVDTDLVGSVRYNGNTLAFGPPSGVAYEAVTLGNPTLTDLKDGSQAYNMGMEFSLVASKNAVGVQWRVPDTIDVPSGGVNAVAIWNADTSTRLAYKEFIPTPGVLQEILFDASISLPTGVQYIATVYTINYVFKSGSPAGSTSPSGNVIAGAGRLTSFNGGASFAPIPEGVFNSTYHISPLIET